MMFHLFPLSASPPIPPRSTFPLSSGSFLYASSVAAAAAAATMWDLKRNDRLYANGV